MLGVLIPSVVVIALGAVAFAIGQTYVTLSFRRGFASGWAVSRPGADVSKRRRGRDDRQDPALEVTGLEAADAGYGRNADFGQDAGAYGGDDEYDRDDVFTPARPVATAAENTSVYEPQPLPDETGSYGIYDPGYAAADASYATAGQTQDQYATAAADPSYSYDGYTGYDQQQYGYDTSGQQQYAAYSDPYIGTQTYDGAAYDTSYGGQQQYGQQGYSQDQYATGSYGDTPAAWGGCRNSAAPTTPTATSRRSSSSTASRATTRTRTRATGSTSSTASRAFRGRGVTPSLGTPELRPLHDESGDERARHSGVRETTARM